MSPLFVKDRLYTGAMFILFAIVLVISFFNLTRDIHDNDFFWHLKSGQWLWENMAFPERDPFAYTTSMLDTGRVRFILTSYWLSQVFYYLFFLQLDMPGIVISRFLIAGLLCFILLKLRKGDKYLSLSLLVMTYALIVRSYPFERPQVFSFIFFGAILVLLDRIKNKPEDRTVFFFLPLVMFVWANMHGGYALGIATILLYITMEGLKFLHPSLTPLKSKAYRRLILIGVAAIIISLVNPASYNVFSKDVLFQPDNTTFNNIEYYSTVRIFREFGDPGVLVYWLFLCCAVLALFVDRKRADITMIALIVFIGYISFTTLRFVAFLPIAALPIIGESFSRLRFIKIVRMVMFSAALALAFLFTAPYAGLETLKSGEWVDDRKFPVGAADFIVQNDIKGNMYNFFNWGGYLIWRLAPEKKVFLDGRILDHFLYEEVSIIDQATVDARSGMPVWKYLLNEFHVDYIIIPDWLPLYAALIRDGDWLHVFSDGTSEIFVRRAKRASVT